jgi:uncharacterized alpha-E superfamily protein
MPAAQIATATIARLGATEIGEVVSSGLHEFLSGFVADNNRLGIALAEQFQFPDYL